MTAYIPILASISGAVVYFMSNNSKVAEIGRIIFATGTLVSVFLFSGKTLHLP